MPEIGIIGRDLARNVFHAHVAGADGSVVFRRKLSRVPPLPFLATYPPCSVAMKARTSAQHWGRAIGNLGLEVRQIPPACVKPLGRRPLCRLSYATGPTALRLHAQICVRMQPVPGRAPMAAVTCPRTTLGHDPALP